MKTWRFQRGDVPIGCLVGGVVALVVVLIAIKVAPLMIDVGELDKEITVLADRASRHDYNDARILRDILQKAEDLNLPVTKTKSPSNGRPNASRSRSSTISPLSFPATRMCGTRSTFTTVS